MLPYVTVTIADTSQIATARRQAAGLAQSLGFGETVAGKVALLITEIASNLIKHTAQGGEILLGSLEKDGLTGIEIISLDRGPGIGNIPDAMRDGFSTAASRGAGLGAIQRLAHQFDLYSLPDRGTVLLARLWSQQPKPDGRLSLEVGGFSVAKPGEEACGDAWSVASQPDGLLILLADGLGHGPDAALAAQEAVRVFRSRSQLGPEQLLEFIHGGLRHTRGAAVAVAQINTAQSNLCYGGLGNISAQIIAGPERNSRHLVSLNGTAGHAARKIQQLAYPWSAGSLLILHSDGLATRWNLSDYPGLSQREPSLIAATLYRDFRRGSDDTNVVVIRERE